jgi:hypothetical protein
MLTVDILMFYISTCYNVWVNELMVRYSSSKSGQREFADNTSDIRAGIAAGWMAGVRFLAVAGFFSFPQCPDRLLAPPSLLSNGYWGL